MKAFCIGMQKLVQDTEQLSPYIRDKRLSEFVMLLYIIEDRHGLSISKHSSICQHLCVGYEKSHEPFRNTYYKQKTQTNLQNVQKELLVRQTGNVEYVPVTST